MINIFINRFNHGEGFFEKEISTRVLSVIVTAYFASMAIGSSIAFTVMFPYELFVSLRGLSSDAKGVKRSFSHITNRFNKLILQECANTIFTAAAIPLSPFESAQKKLETKTNKTEEGINHKEVARRTDGFTVSDIGSLIKKVIYKAFEIQSNVTHQLLLEVVQPTLKKMPSVSGEEFIGIQEGVD